VSDKGGVETGVGSRKEEDEDWRGGLRGEDTLGFKDGGRGEGGRKARCLAGLGGCGNKGIEISKGVDGEGGEETGVAWLGLGRLVGDR